MTRYVFFRDDAGDGRALQAAKKIAAARGAVVLKAVAGTLLVEATPEQLAEMVLALPGWQYAIERKDARVPERRSLERAKPRGNGGGQR